MTDRGGPSHPAGADMSDRDGALYSGADARRPQGGAQVEAGVQERDPKAARPGQPSTGSGPGSSSQPDASPRHRAPGRPSEPPDSPSAVSAPPDRAAALDRSPGTDPAFRPARRLHRRLGLPPRLREPARPADPPFDGRPERCRQAERERRRRVPERRRPDAAAALLLRPVHPAAVGDVARRRSRAPAYRPLPVAPRGFGLPNLRRNVCPHFYVTGTRGAIPIQAPHLLKALIRQDAERLALPAARRRPPRAGLRQRRLPDATLQPVRLLRGRADQGVTGAQAPRGPRERPVATPRRWPRSRRAGRFGIRLGLGRTRAILRALGDPQLAFRGALVAGTNGKGSVLALAGSSLARGRATGSGETPKPHLVTYRERLQINGTPISPDAFAALIGRVLPVADRVARRLGDPTEFEVLTAAIFLWFAEQSVDLAIVEVGPRRPARCDARLGRRRGRGHQRRPRPHGPAGPDDPADRSREGGDHRAWRSGGHGRERGGAAGDPAPGARGWGRR